MKLSPFTMNVLANFADINPGIILHPGSYQRAMSSNEDIIADVQLEEDIPVKFPIHNLPLFLSNVGALKNPDIEFLETHAVIRGEGTSIQYWASSETIITEVNYGKIDMSNPDATFDIDNSALSRLIRLSKMNRWNVFTIIGKNGSIVLQARTLKDDTSNYADIVLGTYEGKDFTASIKDDSFKIIPDDYLGELKLGAFCKLTSKNHKLTYYISLMA